MPINFETTDDGVMKAVVIKKGANRAEYYHLTGGIAHEYSDGK